MNGKPDTIKWSYYASSNINGPTVPEYYGENDWPRADGTGIEGFERAFKKQRRYGTAAYLVVTTVRALTGLMASSARSARRSPLRASHLARYPKTTDRYPDPIFHQRHQ